MAKRSRKIVDPTAPPESKADKFVRLANRRVPNALKSLKHVARLSNKSTYHYEQPQVKLILEALAAEMDRIASAFQPSGDNGQLFKL